MNFWTFVLAASRGNPFPHRWSISARRRGHVRGGAHRHSAWDRPGAAAQSAALGAGSGQRNSDHTQPGVIWLPDSGAVPGRHRRQRPPSSLWRFMLCFPILQNTYTGIAGVDPAVLESARGMGMTPAKFFGNVELPLSMGVILAGVRVAMVISIGVATIAAAIGAGGLGVFIFRGVAMANNCGDPRGRHSRGAAGHCRGPAAGLCRTQAHALTSPSARRARTE